MTYKRLGSMAALLVLLVLPVSASMVSFQLVETGLSQEAASGQYSRLWESGLMSVFFDAGYIVTSSPIARVQARPGPELNGLIQYSFDQAMQSGADYFIVGLIEYSTQTGRTLPAGILLRVYDSNSRLIHQQNFPAGAGRSNNDELQSAQDAARMVISYIKDR